MCSKLDNRTIHLHTKIKAFISLPPAPLSFPFLSFPFLLLPKAKATKDHRTSVPTLPRRLHPSVKPSRFWAKANNYNPATPHATHVLAV